MNLQEDRVFINASAIIKISILMRAYDLPLYMAKLYINFSYVKHAFMIFQPPPVLVVVQSIVALLVAAVGKDEASTASVPHENLDVLIVCGAAVANPTSNETRK